MSWFTRHRVGISWFWIVFGTVLVPWDLLMASPRWVGVLCAAVNALCVILQVHFLRLALAARERQRELQNLLHEWMESL